MMRYLSSLAEIIRQNARSRRAYAVGLEAGTQTVQHGRVARRRTRVLTRTQLLHRLHPLQYTDVPPRRLRWVDPARITAIQRPIEHPRVVVDRYGRVHKLANVCKVIDGAWDRRVRSWEDLSFVRGLRQRFLEGRA